MTPHSPISHNEHQTTTILLIPGAGCSPAMWDPLAPHLPSYHLLCADLTLPYDLERNADELASLVRSRAKNGRAHLVAFSLGTHIAVYLAHKHPDITAGMTVMVTGFSMMKDSWFIRNVAPYAWMGLEGIGRMIVVPEPQQQNKETTATKRTTASSQQQTSSSKPTGDAGLTGLKEEEKEVESKGGKEEAATLNTAVAKSTMSILSSWSTNEGDDEGEGGGSSQGKKPLPSLLGTVKRTLVVVATKGHFGLPTGDSLEHGRTLFRAVTRGDSAPGDNDDDDSNHHHHHDGRSSSGSSRLLEMKSGRHAWPMEQPEVFARCVKWWVGDNDDSGGDGDGDINDRLMPEVLGEVAI